MPQRPPNDRPPPDRVFLARIKELVANTTLMIDESSGSEAVLSMGLNGEKYRLRLLNREEDILLGVESNVDWVPGEDEERVEAAIDDVVNTEDQKAVEFVGEPRGNMKHVVSVTCFTRTRFAEMTPQQFRHWVSLHTAVVASIDKRLRGEVELGTDRRPPSSSARALFQQLAAVARAPRTPKECRAALETMAGVLAQHSSVARLPDDDPTTAQFRRIAQRGDDAAVTKCCRLAAEYFTGKIADG